MARGTLPETRAEAAEEDGALDRRFSRRMALANVSTAAEEISDVGLSAPPCCR